MAVSRRFALYFAGAASTIASTSMSTEATACAGGSAAGAAAGLNPNSPAQALVNMGYGAFNVVGGTFALAVAPNRGHSMIEKGQKCFQEGLEGFTPTGEAAQAIKDFDGN